MDCMPFVMMYNPVLRENRSELFTHNFIPFVAYSFCVFLASDLYVPVPVLHSGVDLYYRFVVNCFLCVVIALSNIYSLSVCLSLSFVCVCVCVCVCACVRACVRACLRACLRARA